jgi:hypothetical protein
MATALVLGGSGLVASAARGPWREAFPGFACMEAGHDLFDYAAEDAYLARAERSTSAGPG